MIKIALLAAATAIALATPAAAVTIDCNDGFKSQLGKLSNYVSTMPGDQLADAVQKSLDVYSSCKAGDAFSPNGTWDRIIADMEAKKRS